MRKVIGYGDVEVYLDGEQMSVCITDSDGNAVGLNAEVDTTNYSSRLVLESGPDPVEVIKARIAEVTEIANADPTNYIAEGSIDGLRWALAAIEGRE